MEKPSKITKNHQKCIPKSTPEASGTLWRAKLAAGSLRPPLATQRETPRGGRLPFWVGTKAAETDRFLAPSARRRHRPTLVVDPRSSACLGRHGAVLGHHTRSLGGRAAHPRARPPPLTTFARKAPRAAALCKLRRLSCCRSEDANTIVARVYGECHYCVFCMPRLLRWSCGGWSGHKTIPLKLSERRRPASCTQLVCTPRVESARGCHG